MVSTWDKAIVALVLAVIQIVELWGGWSFGITEQWVLGLLAILSPILVWLVPNMPRSAVAARTGATR